MGQFCTKQEKFNPNDQSDRYTQSRKNKNKEIKSGLDQLAMGAMQPERSSLLIKPDKSQSQIKREEEEEILQQQWQEWQQRQDRKKQAILKAEAEQKDEDMNANEGIPKKWEVVDVDDKKKDQLKNLYKELDMTKYVHHAEGDQDDPDNIFKCHLDQLFGMDVKDVQVFYLNYDFKKKLKIVKKAQELTLKKMLQTDFHERLHDQSPIDIKQNWNECFNNMKKVNFQNWQYLILQESGEYAPINDYDSMMIGHEMVNIKVNKLTSKRLHLNNIVVNMYSGVIYNEHRKATKLLVRAKDNNRGQRKRPENTKKAFDVSLLIEPKEVKHDAFAEKLGFFAKEWGKRTKNSEKATPTFTEMMNGIYEWYHSQLIHDELLDAQLQAHRTTFSKLLKNSNINNTTTAFTMDKDDPLKDAELGLMNPYSKITCFVLMLYSMEFGSPPLYCEINRVTRDKDLKCLLQLGPYARALQAITLSAEKRRVWSDQINTGAQISQKFGGVQVNMAGSFLLYRGAQMKEEWIEPYRQCIMFDNEFKEGKYRTTPLFVNLPSYTSCSQRLRVGLKFATNNPKPDCTPVLFVITCRNFYSSAGIRMNNEAYTAYPSEKEFLLTEGCGVYVLAVQDVLVNNPEESFEKFTDKVVTVIYLFTD